MALLNMNKTYGPRFLELLLGRLELLLELHIVLVEGQEFGFGFLRQVFAPQARPQVPTQRKKPSQY